MTRAASVLDDQATHSFAAEQLRAIVERVERLEAEKKTIADDIKDVYGEAKGNGYDVKTLRTIIRMRKQDANERAEQETILETYMQALGMLAGTPLGDAAMRAASQPRGRGGRAQVTGSTMMPQINVRMAG